MEIRDLEGVDRMIEWSITSHVAENSFLPSMLRVIGLALEVPVHSMPTSILRSGSQDPFSASLQGGGGSVHNDGWIGHGRDRLSTSLIWR